MIKETFLSFSIVLVFLLILLGVVLFPLVKPSLGQS